MPDASTIALIALILCGGAALQSAAGFGFGMFAVPLLILAGRPSGEAIVMVATCGGFQLVTGLWTVRRHIQWRDSCAHIALTACGVPIGVALLGMAAAVGADRIKQLIGGVLLVALITQLIWRPTPREKLHPGWAFGACGLGGIMGGFAGMGGPPIVLWIMAHDWSTHRARATMWMIFLGMLPFQAFFLAREFGSEVWTAAGLAALIAPLTFLGVIPGLWIGHRMSRVALRRLALGILFVIAFAAIAGPWMS